MNYNKTAELAEALQALAFAAGSMTKEFENLVDDFYNNLSKIQNKKKICNSRRKAFEKFTVTEIYFSLLPYGYTSGIPP